MDRLDERGVRLAFAELKGTVRDRLLPYGLVERIGMQHFYRTTGEAVHAYLGHLPDADIEEMLDDLAMALGAALGQERLYVAFCDRTWILSCEPEAS